jgi:hypothetical protein
VIASGNAPIGTVDTANIASAGCISSAVSVGATTDLDKIASFSMSAPFLSLVAPGVDIVSAIPRQSWCLVSGVWSRRDYCSKSGTSSAAPHVAAAFAIHKQTCPTCTVGQILNALQTNGLKVADDRTSLFTAATMRRNCRIQIDAAVRNRKPKFYLFPIAEFYAYDINNCAQVIGTEYVDWTGRITDTKGFTTNLIYNGPLPAEPQAAVWLTEAWGLNERGEASGFMCCGYYGDRGWTRDVNGVFKLEIYPGSETNDTYKNSNTETVGYAWEATGDSDFGYAQKNGVYRKISGLAMDIDNMSRFAGWVGSTGQYTDATGLHTYAYPGATNTYLYARNESGLVIGHGWFPATFTTVGFLLDTVTGKVTVLQGEPYGLNDSRQIVGAKGGQLHRHELVT